MSISWVKSLQCKSRAYDDVHVTSVSCRNSYQNLKDVVNVDPSKPRLKPDRPGPFESKVKRSKSVKPNKPTEQCNADRDRRSVSGPMTKGSGPITGLVGVTELVEGHPSRNVVEIIFRTRWGSGGFPGRVEMVFKVQTPSSGSARFEEYRDSVKKRAGPGSGSGARCVADGNEMMRFHCLGPTTGLSAATMMEGCDGATSAPVVTYSGSGVAHERAGGGKGRRAMAVCRVIAGRVLKRVDPVVGKTGEFDSVSGENGELLVYDSRAILPCFLIIYRL
ncbi:hypothetical protein RND81_08G128100 [Saponaria officinalis]|uniref:Uncharacterized protein n=1 Tax=Saponaria officinalis TaxID=3572 RepID=A0AAW1J6K9_SAPOF